MPFPSTAVAKMISGLPGELAFDGPSRGGVAIINSTDAANNVFGRMLTYNDEDVETLQAGGTGALAGVLQHPKAWAVGSSTVPNNSICEFMIEGEIYVTLGATGAIGAALYYETATGIITPTAAGGVVIPGASIVRHLPSVETPLLAVVHIPGIIATPAAA